MSRHRRNVAFNLAGYAVPLALSLLTIPLYLAVLGIERFGVLQMAWLFLGYFGMLDLGLGKATAYFLAKPEDDAASRREILYTSLVLSIGIGLLIGAVFYLIAVLFFGVLFQVSAPLRAEVLPVLPVLALSVPVGVLTSTYISALGGRGQFLTMNLLGTGSTILFQVAPLAVAFIISPTLTLIVPVAIGARIIGLIAYAIACTYSIGKPGGGLVSVKTMRDLVSYGGWAALSSILSPMLQLADRMSIGAVLGAVAVATYTIPLQFAQRMTVLPSSVALALFPKMVAGGPEDRTEIVSENMVGMGSLLLAGLAVALPLFPEFLRLWLGSHYQAEVGKTAIILLVGYFFNGLALYPCVQLQASGEPRKIAEAYIYEIPFYFGLLYLLMTYLGVIGAAAALAARFLADLVLLYGFANRQLPPREFWMQAAALIAVATAAILLPMSRTGIGLMVACSIFALVCGAVTAPKRMRGQAIEVIARLTRRRVPVS